MIPQLPHHPHPHHHQIAPHETSHAPQVPQFHQLQIMLQEVLSITLPEIRITHQLDHAHPHHHPATVVLQAPHHHHQDQDIHL